jgi:hypothetical protein
MTKSRKRHSSKLEPKTSLRRPTFKKKVS